MSLRSGQQARCLMDQALMAQQAGDTAQAAKQVQKALALKPDLASARQLQVQLDLENNKPQKAMTQLDALVLYHPQLKDDQQVLHLRTQVLVLAGDQQEACDVLETLTTLYPHDDLAWGMLASCYFKRGKTQQAIGALKQVLVLKPNHHTARRTLADWLAKTNPQQSIQLLRDLPNALHDASTLWQLAQLYQQTGRLHDAHQVYQQAIDLASNEPTLLQEAATLADQLGYCDLAIDQLKQAISNTPDQDCAPLQHQLAKVYLHAGQPHQAGLIWMCLTCHDQYHKQAWAGVWVTSQLLDKPSLSKQALSTLERLAGKQGTSELISALWVHGGHGGQEAHRVPSSSDTHQVTEANASTWGQPLTQLLQQASQALTEHQQKYPQRADTLYHLAQCQHAQKEPARAKQYAQQALDINPHYQAAQNLAQALAD